MAHSSFLGATPRPNQRRNSKPPVLVLLLSLLLVLVTAPSAAAAVDVARADELAYMSYPTTVLDLSRRQFPDINVTRTDTSTSASPTPAQTTTTFVITSTTTTVLIQTTTTVATHTFTTVPSTVTLSRTLTSSLSATVITNTTATATASQSPSDGSGGQGFAIGGAAVGGLVFVIGIAIVAFRCTLNRRDRQRRNKEMAATLAENFDGRGDPIGTPRKGYLELNDDGPPTPSSGRLALSPGAGAGANLSRQGSQDPYFAAHKEGSVVGGGQQEFYNPHYVQERYGAASNGNYGMYEETELSVIGGSSGRSGGGMTYPPSSMTNNHYAGYDNYGGHADYGHHDGGYYGGGAASQPPRGPQGY